MFDDDKSVPIEQGVGTEEAQGDAAYSLSVPQDLHDGQEAGDLAGLRPGPYDASLGRDIRPFAGDSQDGGSVQGELSGTDPLEADCGSQQPRPLLIKNGKGAQENVDNTSSSHGLIAPSFTVFGESVLPPPVVTQEDPYTECVLTIKSFAQGGNYGQALLKRHLPVIFQTYGFSHWRDKRRLLMDSGLTPFKDIFHTTYPNY